ncbi:hypothetical protein [uncultured Clostridium sp.]|uniref:hypothetical protein n=1 Tax=uncultured Clostridium sp. TaxID=59620 RepID=UPI0028E404D9|nr:hypothetical protein [uncultured Clostridium sp.]
MEERLNQSLPEPELIAESRRTLNIIQAVLIAFRVIIILFYVILSIFGLEDMYGNIVQCFLEIGVLFFFLHTIKNGHKKIAILPLLGGIVSFKFISESFSSSNGDIFLTLLSCYIALMGMFQLVSMAYILLSRRIEFYCYYVLYNKKN